MTTTTHGPICFNSTDSRCGPFHWVGIVNEPSSIEAQVVTASPHYVGAPLVVRVHISDPDSPTDCSEMTLLEGLHDIGLAWPSSCDYFHCANGTGPSDFGPWFVPPNGSTDVTHDYTLRPKQAAHVKMQLDTISDGCPSLVGAKSDPYGSRASTTLEFDVIAAPTTTT